MGQNSGYTHGGNPAKNAVLLLRALFNLVGFALLWIGLGTWETPGDFATVPVLAIVGAVICAIGLVVNLIGPFLHRAKK